MAYLFAAAQTEKPSKTVRDMAASVGSGIGTRRLQMAVDKLENDDDMVEDISSSNSIYAYALTSTGYDYAEKSYLAPDSTNFKSLVDALLERINDKTPDTDRGKSDFELLGVAVPSADRFVEIGHNSAGYDQTLQAIESAAEVIRQSNTIDADERSWIQSNLTVAISAMKTGGKILKQGISTFALEPLKAALNGVTEEKLKSIIAVAIAAVKSYFGL